MGLFAFIFPTIESADLLQKLSLDSQSKDLEVTDSEKKVVSLLFFGFYYCSWRVHLPPFLSIVLMNFSIS